jgi:alkylation response protein AidB-like acyl-CoA dehydrogenase
MLSDEQRQLRDTARDFAQRELEPHAGRWDREREVPAEALRALAELGFLGLLVPEEQGGSGFDALGFCLAIEEISRSVPALGLLLSIHNGPVCHLVRAAATPEARARWLPRLAAGDVLGTFALSELGAGSDIAGIATTYRRVAAEPPDAGGGRPRSSKKPVASRGAPPPAEPPDAGGGRPRSSKKLMDSPGAPPPAGATAAAAPASGFLLTGEKAWVSGVGVAGLAVVFARSAEAGNDVAGPAAAAEPRSRGNGGPDRRAGLSAFLVDLEATGVSEGPAEETMGLRAAPVGSLALDGAVVPAEDLLGREGSGFALAQDALAVGRLGIAAQSLGIAGRCIALAVAYARERRQFGRPISEFQGVRLPLADLAARLEAARALVYLAASEPECRDHPARCAMAKLVASELAMAAALQAVQAFGGYGYVKDYPVERFFRDAKACQIYEGTNEIQRVVIAKELFHD